MKHTTIVLSEERGTTLQTYFIENTEEYQNGHKRPLVVICPGGAYAYLSKRESEPIALRFLSAGFHAAVLNYGVMEQAKAPGPLQDLADAVSLIRDQAATYYIDPNQIYVCGFSAGGHVACQLGVFWNNGDLLPKYKDCPEKIRPNGMILAYPVIDLTLTGHGDLKKAKISMDMDLRTAMNTLILGDNYTSEQEEFYSLQQHVSSNTPPTFLWHAGADCTVYPSNSLSLASALDEAGVSCELHVYAGGTHGLALSDYVTANQYHQCFDAAATWTELAVNWLNRLSHFSEELGDL